MKKVAIIYPSSGGSKDDLEFGVSLLEDAGLEINIINYKSKNDWPIYISTQDERESKLLTLLEDNETDIIWFARGGYGASELLEKLNSANITSKKTLIGFSDISSIHSTFIIIHL